MCGISGIYNLDQKPCNADLLVRMNNTMSHRGPDGYGVHVDGPLGLGHRRLSIIDLSTGDQPMSGVDGKIWVVFNGEIYNFLELRSQLQSRGHVFATRSDTEVIIYAYREWGEDFVARLRGMFAFSLWDSEARKLLLARDRIGKKPLYYLKDSHRLLFASEMKALLEDPDVPREMDYQALDAFLSFGYVPSPFSIFRHIRKLPPAHFAVVQGDRFDIRPYWRLNMDAPISDAPEERMVEDILNVFDEAVKIRLISDVPLGAFLSGGIDSTAVVAAMAGFMAPEPVKTVSIGFSDPRFNELGGARITARAFKTDHVEHVVAPDSLGILEKLVWHFDEPFADASAIPTYYVSKMARKTVTVALSGDGGDETFAGYVNRYTMTRTEDEIRRRIPEPFRRLVVAPLAARYPRVDTWPRPLRLKSFLAGIAASFDQAYFRNMSFFFLPEMKKRLYLPHVRSAVADFDAFDVFGPHLADIRNPDPVTRAQYLDIKTYLPEDILVKVDRMSMANSLEVRAPLLDHVLMEVAGRLPSSMKLAGAKSKYVFKKANIKRMPPAILQRPKQGFSIPLPSWLREEARNFAEHTLFSQDSGLGDFFDLAYVKDLWRLHQSKRQNHATPLWGLMMFALWRKRFLVK